MHVPTHAVHRRMNSSGVRLPWSTGRACARAEGGGEDPDRFRLSLSLSLPGGHGVEWRGGADDVAAELCASAPACHAVQRAARSNLSFPPAPFHASFLPFSPAGGALPARKGMEARGGAPRDTPD